MAKESLTSKLLRLAVVLVPAVIFFGFYLNGLRHRHAQTQPVTPPALTVDAGTSVTLGAYSFQARQPFFTRTLNEPDNTILAGPKQLFAIVPVFISLDGRPVRPSGLTWQMVDDRGTAHPRLTPKNLIVPPALASPAPGAEYLVFALPDTSRKPFLLLTAPAGQAAWRLTRPA